MPVPATTPRMAGRPDGRGRRLRLGRHLAAAPGLAWGQRLVRI